MPDESDLQAALQGLSEADRKRLHDSGYRTLADVTHAGLATLSDDTGVGEAELAGFLRRVQGGSAMRIRGRVAVAPPAAAPHLHRPAPAIVTFCEELDQLLGGGIATGRLTELVGGVGVGKTQVLLQLACNVQIPVAFGGAGGCAIVVDTEGGVMQARLEGMAHHLAAHLESHGAVGVGFAQSLLRNIMVIRAFDSAELLAVAALLPAYAAEHATATGLPCRLFAVDSVAAPFRSEGGGEGFSSALAERQRALSRLGKALTGLAIEHGAAVVAANHVTARMGEEGGLSGGGGGPDAEGIVIPALGNMWGHEVTDRVVLMRMKTGRLRANIDKSPDKAQGSCFYSVTPQGIRSAAASR